MSAIRPVESSLPSRHPTELWAHQRSVHPGRSTQRTESSVDVSFAYEITASGPLPVINIAQSLRSVWLHGGVEKAYARFTRRWKVVILGCYSIGFACFWVVLVAPACVGRWLAPLASLPTTFTSVVYFLLLRYEIVRLVVRTYEFWFFSTANLVSAVLLAIHLGDVRATIAVPVWFTLQNNILTDANTVFSRIFMAGAGSTLLFLLFLIATVSFDFIDGAYKFDLLRIDANRRLVVQDAIIQGYTTQAIMLARNMYRRWTTPTRSRETPPRATTITCVTLRARVKLWRLEPLSGNHVHGGLPRADSVVSQANGSTLIQLKLIPVLEQFCSDQIVVPAVREVLFFVGTANRNTARVILSTIAYVGLSLAVVTSLFPTITYSNELRVVSFVCSSLFIGCLSMTGQRQLLRRLVCTFDFAFLSIQLVVVHVCLCDMLGWGYAALPVATIWLWIQWVLTHDAVTPVVKAKWGIRRRLPAIIMLVFIESQVLIFVAVLAEDTIELRNRVILCFTIGRHVLEIKVIPTLLSRMVILFGWSWKVLWRMWTIRDDELLMIQGAITYVNLRHERKLQSTTNATRP